MHSVKARLAIGLALVLLVTTVLAGAVATSAAIGIELSDGDECETGGNPEVRTTPTRENVSAIAGNVTRCIAGGDDAGGAVEGPPP